MSPTVLRRIALVLVVALAGWGALVLRNRNRTDAPAGLALPALPPAQVDDVILGAGAGQVHLVRGAAGWTVNGFPAAGPAVTAWLAAARDTLAQSELIARSAAPHARLGLDSATARRLTVRAGGQVLLDLLIGSRGPEFEGFYVRPATAPASYMLRGEFAEGLARGVDEWREKTILALAGERMGGVTVRLGRSVLPLVRSGGRWTVAGAPVDSAKVARYLGQFADVRAAGFPSAAEADSLDFAAPEREVVVLGTDGRPLETLTLDSTASGGFWLRTAAGVVYRVDGATANRLTTALATLR